MDPKQHLYVTFTYNYTITSFLPVELFSLHKSDNHVNQHIASMLYWAYMASF